MKNNHQKPKYKVLPEDENSLKMQTELGISHSGFQDEYRIFLCIKAGNTQELQKLLKNYFSHEMVMGRMSRNTLRQVQYWAVATISLAVHYAILGGLDETDAFNTSDKVILMIDSCTTADEIFEIILEQAVNLTEKVGSCSEKAAVNPAVKKCLHYIHMNLNKKITLEDLSRITGFSKNYVSLVFRSEMKMSPLDYVHLKKIELAKVMLADGESYAEISYSLGFCSESHFIAVFKKITGSTPGDFAVD